MAAFNILGKIFSTLGHGKGHVTQVLEQNGIQVDWQDNPTSPPAGYVSGPDNLFIRADTARYDKDGKCVGGQTDGRYC